MTEEQVSTLGGQPCPICNTNNLTLTEQEMEIPYFGNVYLFTMSCSNCSYHKADVESVEQKEPCKYTLDVSSEEDLNIRIVKSSQATVKIPHVTTIESGPGSSGYVTNVEGILRRVKKVIETNMEAEEDEELKQKSRVLLKKLTRVLFGQESLKIIIEDPTGNSAIISEKAVRSKL